MLDRRLILILILGPIILLILAACATPPEPTAAALPADDMVTVPAGWFLMGQDDGPPYSQPQRRVYLDALAIDRTEVTNAAFLAFLAATGYQTQGVEPWDAAFARERLAYPVTGVIWADADAYCRWAGKRPPTEAKWEKAARGVDSRRFPWGDEWNPTYANTLESDHGRPLPVGSIPEGASPYGALDMAGNVAEWVADNFDPLYYTYAPDRNPLGPEDVLKPGLARQVVYRRQARRADLLPRFVPLGAPQPARGVSLRGLPARPDRQGGADPRVCPATPWAASS